MKRKRIEVSSAYKGHLDFLDNTHISKMKTCNMRSLSVKSQKYQYILRESFYTIIEIKLQ